MASAVHNTALSFGPIRDEQRPPIRFTTREGRHYADDSKVGQAKRGGNWLPLSNLFEQAGHLARRVQIGFGLRGSDAAPQQIGSGAILTLLEQHLGGLKVGRNISWLVSD